ncbi:high-affinity choline transporter 1-like [Ixodes scapularis]|uniref:high-affinity choline transporter 1-like n=1 Tax=Ixodes scapularis TaxID=6945 RepID=UPI001AD6646D|nr:high-affinity choline transporter 1-like [Ixodes scapularis]
MLAGRKISIYVSVLTMTATWVGGGYINGTAEVVYLSGVVLAYAPFGYALSLAIGGHLFAAKMRKAGFKTMLDPLQRRYGNFMCCLLFLPALLAELFWTAGVLAALGASMEVILGWRRAESVVTFALVALVYTLAGGLYSVVYTDVLQLAVTFFGLWLCVPYAMFHKAVGKISYPANNYFGDIEWAQIARYWDSVMQVVMGGIPWQVYFQRVLACESPEGAVLSSYMAAMGCLIMAMPSIIMGAIARAANLTEAGYTGTVPLGPETASLTLPLVLQHLTPSHVSALGLAAVSAAVMSSFDSSILSAASMFAWNVYGNSVRQSASEKEMLWVMRIATVVIGTVASMIAQLAMSAYVLWYLSSDLVYVLLLPHLLTVTYHNKECNAYGSLAGYVVGAVLRAGGGEDALNIPPFIRYPYYNARDGQLFPFRTFAMVMTYLTLRVVSRVSKWLFTDRVPLKFDLFKCFVAKPPMAKEDVSSKDAEEMPTKSDEQEQPVRHFLGMGVLLPTAVDQEVGVDSAEQKSLETTPYEEKAAYSQESAGVPGARRRSELYGGCEGVLEGHETQEARSASSRRFISLVRLSLQKNVSHKIARRLRRFKKRNYQSPNNHGEAVELCVETSRDHLCGNENILQSC